jgi:hypothetical protein
MWLFTLGFIYIMIQTGAGFFGFPNPINDLLFGSAEKRAAEKIARNSPVKVPEVPIVTPANFHSSSYGSDLPVTQTAIQAVIISRSVTPDVGGGGVSAVPDLPVQSPTLSPTPSPIPTLRSYVNLGKIWAIGYSYYFPPLGGINCAVQNWHDNYCDDVTASGLRWTEYIGKGVAVPVQWRDEIPLLSVVRVLDNVIMQGDYLVLDYCGDCIKKEGHVYFDFLDNRPRLNWTVPLLVQLISVP